MAKRILIKGNQAIGEAAMRAGCRAYFGYPITPQSELLEYMAQELPKRGGVFVQTESELAGSAMLYAATATGVRALTSSSSPGISLMQEVMSCTAAAELPALFVNISRGGPGSGRIVPAQSDYFQATRGGGHGDYRFLVFAPSTVREMAEYTIDAYELAEKYRVPAMILGDAMTGQSMESIEESCLEPKHPQDEKPWAVTGMKDFGEDDPRTERHLVLNHPYTDAELIEQNIRFANKYKEIEEKEIRWEEYRTEGAEIIIAAFGIIARFAKTAVDLLREKGYRVGLFRPILLWPYPSKPLAALAENCRAILTMEMNEGQMVEDVRLAVNGRCPVDFHGHGGGYYLNPYEMAELIKEKYFGGEKK